MSGSASLFDTNVWVALTFSSHPFHIEAVAEYSRATPDHPAIFCRSTQQSFLRIASTPAILQQYGAGTFTNRDALSVLNRFLAAPEVEHRDEPPGIEPVWHQYAATKKASPNLWMDAYLAAFAKSGGYRFVTIDKGFKQFKGLDLVLLAKP